MKDKKIFIIFGLMAVAGACSWFSHLKTYEHIDSVNIHIFPKEINGWKAEELPITDDEYAILETRNAFVRNYTSPNGQIVQLFIIYSESNRKVAHPPEVCYTGSGFTVADNQVARIEDIAQHISIETHRLVLEQKRYRQVAYYWFKVGNVFTASYWRQQFLIAFQSLINKPVSSALIRVSSVVRTSDEVVDRELKEFTRLIVPHLYDYLP